MKSLTAYMSNAGKICPMVLLVGGELGRNAAEVSASANLSKGEKDRLQEWIADACALCAKFLNRHPPADSVRGDAIRRNVYKDLKNDVDVVTRMTDGSFRQTEIKYAIKPYSYGPFSMAKRFVDSIAVKFDQLEREMKNDGEAFDSVRAILVSDDHFGVLQMAVSDLINAQEALSTDGEKHEYVLCTLGGLIDCRSGHPFGEGVFRFVV